MTKRLVLQYCSHCPNITEEQEASDRAHTLSGVAWQKWLYWDITSGGKSLTCYCSPSWESSLLTQSMQDTCPFTSLNRDVFQSLSSQITKSKSNVQSKTLYFKFLNWPVQVKLIRRVGKGKGVGREGDTSVTHTTRGTGAPAGWQWQGHCTLAAGGRLPGATRASMVSGGSSWPTAELPSMSKGEALSSPDAAREQAAPQRSHRGRTAYQAELKAISPLTSDRALPGARPLLVVAGPHCGAAVPHLFYLLCVCSIQMWELKAAQGAT